MSMSIMWIKKPRKPKRFFQKIWLLQRCILSNPWGLSCALFQTITLVLQFKLFKKNKSRSNNLEIVDELYEVTARGKRRQFIGYVQLDALACHQRTACVVHG